MGTTFTSVIARLLSSVQLILSLKEVEVEMTVVVENRLAMIVAAENLSAMEVSWCTTINPISKFVFGLKLIFDLRTHNQLQAVFIRTP